MLIFRTQTAAIRKTTTYYYYKRTENKISAFISCREPKLQLPIHNMVYASNNNDLYHIEQFVYAN